MLVKDRRGDWSHPCSIKLGLRCHCVPTDSVHGLRRGDALKLCSWMAVCTFVILFKLLQITSGQPAILAFLHNAMTRKTTWAVPIQAMGSTHPLFLTICSPQSSFIHKAWTRPKTSVAVRNLRLSFVNTVCTPGWGEGFMWVNPTHELKTFPIQKLKWRRTHQTPAKMQFLNAQQQPG